MTAGTAVNTGQVELRELQQGEREQQIFHMKPNKAKLIFTIFLLIFTFADCILPSFAFNELLLWVWILLLFNFVMSVVFLKNPHPSLALCWMFSVLQTILATLILVANINFFELASFGELIGGIILNVCYYTLLGIEIFIVVNITKQRKIHATNAIDQLERELGSQGSPYVAQAPPVLPTVTVAPPTNGASGPVTTTTVITTYNTAPGQPVIIPSEIPAIHGIPPGPLNPASLASNQVYARTTSNMFTPQIGQMVPPAPVPLTSFATAPPSDHVIPSAPPQLYDYPPEQSEHYEAPPAEDDETPIFG